MKFNNAYSQMFPGYPDAVSLQQAAEMLGLNRHTVGELIRSRRLFALKIGRTSYPEAERDRVPAHRTEHLPGWKSAAGCGMLWVQQRTARLLTQRRFMMKTTGSVQEKNGRFYFVVNLYDANGKRRIKWISTGLTVRGNKRKAESMLREVLLHYDETGELPTGRGGAYEKVDAKTAKPLPQPLQPVSKSEMLFLDYLNEWVQVHKASIQPATFISYNRMITGRITQYFEPLGLKLCEVTPQVLDEFQEKILLEGYTTNTVIHYHAIFGKAFKDAVRKDYLETNPMLKVDRPKKNSFRPNFYSKDEVQQLLEVSQDDPLHLCILITAYYGLRRSEVLGLKWSSIDFERKSITINHKVTEQLVNGKYVPVVSDVMKNKTSCRTLPLIPAVEKELLKQKEKQQLYRKLFKKSYSTEYLDFVCTDQEGKLIRPNFVTEHFDWLLTKYGLKHIRFHDLRHSCASLMVMNGVSMKQVQEWLGHSTFSTTADIYAHLDYKSKQGSAGVIANLLGESKLPK